MGNIKEQVQNIIETCQRLYEAEGASAVFKHVFEGMEAKLPLYDNIQYKRCEACDGECPSIIDICLVCGQSLPLQNVQFPVPLSEPKSAEDVSLGKVIHTVGELRYLMEGLDDHDQIVVEACDEFGDVEDLYPMSLDVIENVQLTNGQNVREVRFCQRPNSEPDTRNKQRLVDALIDVLAEDIEKGDVTVLDELLLKMPFDVLKYALPEDMWADFEEPKKDGDTLIPVK